jgi:hypothetical protein
MEFTWKSVLAMVGGIIFMMLLLWLSPKWFVTFAIAGVGFTMVWKTANWIEMFGRNSWAEEHLSSGFGSGMGGSWMLYKLLGIIMILAAFMYVTGLLQQLLVSVLGTFFGAGQQ